MRSESYRVMRDPHLLCPSIVTNVSQLFYKTKLPVHTIIYLFSTWLTGKAYFCVCRTYAGRLVANARSESCARREVSSFSNHSTCTSHALARPPRLSPSQPRSSEKRKNGVHTAGGESPVEKRNV